MIRSTLIPASPAHIGRIATRMREIDRIECAAFGRSPKEGLRYSLRTSIDAMTSVAPDGTPLAMFGVSAVNLLSGIGSPWFLGREEVFCYPRDLLVYGRLVIERWLEIFDRLENVISVDNDRAIRLLKKWGASVGYGPTVTHGGVAFIRFRIER